jgi:hypothetical protein
VALPAAFIAIFALHFRSLGEFLTFRMRYEPIPADTVVRLFIEAGNRWPMMHDPHVIAYLVLPLFPLAALGLYALGKRVRPALAAVGLATSIAGTIYLLILA